MSTWEKVSIDGFPPGFPLNLSSVAEKRRHLDTGIEIFVDNAGGYWAPPALAPRLGKFARAYLTKAPWYLHQPSGWFTTSNVPNVKPVPVPALDDNALITLVKDARGLWDMVVSQVKSEKTTEYLKLGILALAGAGVLWYLAQPSGARDCSRWGR